jgi:hypothetical protein
MCILLEFIDKNWQNIKVSELIYSWNSFYGASDGTLPCNKLFSSPWLSICKGQGTMVGISL